MKAVLVFNAVMAVWMAFLVWLTWSAGFWAASVVCALIGLANAAAVVTIYRQHLRGE